MSCLRQCSGNELQGSEIDAAGKQVFQRHDAVQAPDWRVGVGCAGFVNALSGVNLFIVDDQHLAVLDVQNLDVLYTLALGITLLRDEGHLAAAIAEILCAGAIAGAYAVRTAAPFVHRQQPAIMITRDAVVYLVLGGGSGQVFGKHGALPGGCIPHGGGAVFVVGRC